MLDNVDAVSAGTEITGEVTTPPPQIDSNEPSNDTPDFESRAKAMGWSPREEWRGDPTKHVDAETWVRRAEENAPLAIDNLRKVTEKAVTLERTVAEMRAREAARDEEFRRLSAMSQINLQRQRQQIEASYRQAQRNAVANMDTASFDQLEQDRAVALQQFDQSIQQAVPQQQPAQAGNVSPEYKARVDTWVQQNPWFTQDPELNKEGRAYSQYLALRSPAMEPEEHLAKVKEHLQREYPSKFGKSPASQQSRQMTSSAVEGGARVPSSTGPRRRGVADLPAEAAKQAAQDVKDGLYKSTQEWADFYWNLK